MSEMVERVAKAIESVLGTPGIERCVSDQEMDRCAEDLRIAARAAIAAMRQHLAEADTWFEECQECGVVTLFDAALNDHQ